MTIQAPWNDRLAEPLTRDHVVQLYSDERFLVEAVALFAGRGLGKGEAVVVVATPAHHAAIQRRLEAQGFAVADLERWGQLVAIDAASLLAQFMRDGQPEAERFERLMGDLIARTRAAGRYRKVRVYGEMVDLLWRRNPAAALRLERLWNQVVRAHAIALFCAYCVAADGDERQRFPAALLRDVHFHVIPHEACA